MILISHRGNINNSTGKSENNPNRICSVIDMGYHVEIDVWLKAGLLFLGHDSPDYQVDLDFLKNDALWCHAKNLDALQLMLKNDIHCFWHQTDDFTLTSRGYIWTYPNKKTCAKSIIVCDSIEEVEYYSSQDIYGICSDYVEILK